MQEQQRDPPGAGSSCKSRIQGLGIARATMDLSMQPRECQQQEGGQTEHGVSDRACMRVRAGRALMLCQLKR